MDRTMVEQTVMKWIAFPPNALWGAKFQGMSTGFYGYYKTKKKHCSLDRLVETCSKDRQLSAIPTSYLKFQIYCKITRHTVK